MLIMEDDELLSCNVKPFDDLNELERQMIGVLLSGQIAALMRTFSAIEENLFYLSLHKQKHLDRRSQRQLYDVYGVLSLLVQRLDSVNFVLSRGDGVE